MKKNIEDYIFHKENFLDEKYCDNCINELNACEWKKHARYGREAQLPVFDNLPTEESEKESKAIDIERHIKNESLNYTGDIIQSGGQRTPSTNVEDINDFIVEKLRPAIGEYVENLKFHWFGGWEGYTAIKFIRYHQGQEMVTHCDHIHSMFDGVRKGVPILSLIGILSNDYEGGELTFFEDKKIDTEKGDLLIFPSNFLYPHKVTPVTKGTRYSYVSWIW